MHKYFKGFIIDLIITQVTDFFYQFKNTVVETDEIVTQHQEAIKEYSNILKEENIHKEYEENYLTILGYAHRLENINDRIFYTFQEAIYAIDLAKQMKDDNAIILNSIVYILVLNNFVDEYFGKKIDEETKQLALKTYEEIEKRQAKENQKYHVYQ